MRARKKLVVEIAAIVVGAIGVVVIGGHSLREGGCGGDLGGMCGNQILKEYPSPNRRMRVTVFQRDCGATTGFSTQASLLPAERALPAGGGNIFVADTDHGAAPAGPGSGPRVDASWVSNDNVIVRHHAAAHIFKAETRYEEITVGYEIVPAPDRSSTP